MKKLYLKILCFFYGHNFGGHTYPKKFGWNTTYKCCRCQVNKQVVYGKKIFFKDEVSWMSAIRKAYRDFYGFK